MSLQDSNVVRTAAELEKKYNFAKLLGLGKNLETVSGKIIKVENELNKMLNSLIINLKDVLDSQSDISLWFYSGTPTTSNLPYTSWATPSDHIGDIYYDQSTGKVFQYNGVWEVNPNPDLVESMAITNSELDVSDHERKVFFSTPQIPYSNGDWWIKSDGSLFICQITKTTGTYEENDFISSSSYTESVAEKIGEEIKVLKGTITTISDSFAKFTDLANPNSSTTIAGENVSTGIIKSNNYAPATASTPTVGTAINLLNGTIDSKNFKLDNQGNIDVQGYITSGKGIITNLQFAGSSNDWNAEGMADNKGEYFLGFNQVFSLQTYAMKNICNFFCAKVYIPEDFIVKSANIVINHSPVNWNGNTGYCRKVKAYDVTDYMDKDIFAEYESEFQAYPDIVFNSNNELSDAFGQNGKTFDDDDSEVFASGDISDMFKNNGDTVSGNYFIAVKPTDTIPSYIEGQNPNQVLGIYTGFVSMMVNIIGYTKIN